MAETQTLVSIKSYYRGNVKLFFIEKSVRGLKLQFHGTPIAFTRLGNEDKKKFKNANIVSCQS